MSEPPRDKSVSRSPPPATGFTRGGFAPIPHRHSDLPPVARSPSPPPVAERSERDWDRGNGRERELPRRELDPDPTEERWERRERDEYERRLSRGGHWEDEHDRPKRRRSPSPHIPSHRQRVASSSPPRYYSNHGPRLPDPASIESLLPFRSFAEWFRTSHPQTARIDEEETRKHRTMIEEGTATEAEAKEKVGMARRYERYRKEYTSRQLYALFLTHRDSAWFIERYSHLPEYAALRGRLNRQGRVPQVETYIEELRAGERDEVVFDQAENVELKETSRVADHDDPERERDSGRQLGAGGEWTEDDAVRVEIAPRTKQVFVKTVPPTATRKSLEDMFSEIPGFRWMAMSDPSTKRSFHRVAWAQYAPDTDVSDVIQKVDGRKIDGFIFHMTINASPTIGRLRIAPPLTNDLERLLEDGEKARALALKLEDELMEDDGEDEVVEDEVAEGTPAASGAVAVGTAEEGQKEKAGKKGGEEKSRGLKERGSEVVLQVIERLLEKHGLDGEDLDHESRVRKAKITLDQWISYLRQGLSTCYYCVAPCSFAEELHRKCIGHVRAHPSAVKPAEEQGEEKHEEKHEESGHVPAVAEEEGKRDSAVAGVEGGEEDHEVRGAEEVIPVTGAGAGANGGGGPGPESPQKRKKLFYPTKSADEKWLETHAMRIGPFLGEVDVVQYGGRDPEEETRKLCAPLIKQEEANKYRCKDCNKLFRAPEFVIKHIVVKHNEVTQRKVDDCKYLNNFVLDPQHIQPSGSTPAAVDDKIPVFGSVAGGVLSANAGLPLPPMGSMGFDPSMGMALGTNGPMSMGSVAGGGQPNGLGAGGAGGAAGNGGMGFNMMQQQMMMMMQMQQAMMMGGMGMGGGMGVPGQGAMGEMPMHHGGGGGSGGMGGQSASSMASRMGGYAPQPLNSGPLPPPPPGGEDPRARRGRVSYQDLDEAGGGSGGGMLPY